MSALFDHNKKTGTERPRFQSTTINEYENTQQNNNNNNQMDNNYHDQHSNSSGPVTLKKDEANSNNNSIKINQSSEFGKESPGDQSKEQSQEDEEEGKVICGLDAVLLDLQKKSDIQSEKTISKQSNGNTRRMSQIESFQIMMNRADDEDDTINKLTSAANKQKIEDNDSIEEEMHSHSSFMTDSDKASRGEKEYQNDEASNSFEIINQHKTVVTMDALGMTDDYNFKEGMMIATVRSEEQIVKQQSSDNKSISRHEQSSKATLSPIHPLAHSIKSHQSIFNKMSKTQQSLLLKNQGTIQRKSRHSKGKLDSTTQISSINSAIQKRLQNINDQEQGNLEMVKKLLQKEKLNRTQEEKQMLQQYFQRLKVFKDLLYSDKPAYQLLTDAVKVQDVEIGHNIIVEGDKGDTFYIILQGQVAVLKAQLIPITHAKRVDISILNEQQLNQYKEKKIRNYMQALKENYLNIHWSGMDIEQKKVAEWLGIGHNLSLDPRQQLNRNIHFDEKDTLWKYIEMHEVAQKFINSIDQPCLMVNKQLVNLEQGAGFGELALMSDTQRMTTCKANSSCVLGTLNRKNFSFILRIAQKRQISLKIQMLKSFKLFSELSNLKLQKIWYLLEEQTRKKGTMLFKQGEKVDGMFLIFEGQVLYKRRMPIPVLDTLAGKDSLWLKQNTSPTQMNMKVEYETRLLQSFSTLEVVGMEEIIKDRLLVKEKNDQVTLQKMMKFDDLDNRFYNFTGQVESMTAKIYYLSRENFENYFIYISKGLALRELEKRMESLSKQVQTIGRVSFEQVDQNTIKHRSIIQQIKASEIAKHQNQESLKQVIDIQKKENLSKLKSLRKIETVVKQRVAPLIQSRNTLSNLNFTAFKENSKSTLIAVKKSYRAAQTPYELNQMTKSKQDQNHNGHNHWYSQDSSLQKLDEPVISPWDEYNNTHKSIRLFQDCDEPPVDWIQDHDFHHKQNENHQNKSQTDNNKEIVEENNDKTKRRTLKNHFNNQAGNISEPIQTYRNSKIISQSEISLNEAVGTIYSSSQQDLLVLHKRQQNTRNQQLQLKLQSQRNAPIQQKAILSGIPQLQSYQNNLMLGQITGDPSLHRNSQSLSQTRRSVVPQITNSKICQTPYSDLKQMSCSLYGGGARVNSSLGLQGRNSDLDRSRMQQTSYQQQQTTTTNQNDLRQSQSQSQSQGQLPMCQADMVLYLSQQRRKELKLSHSSIKKPQSKFYPATVSLDDFAQNEQYNRLSSVEDLVQKNFLKFGGFSTAQISPGKNSQHQHGLLYTQNQQQQQSCNNLKSMQVSKSLVNFAKVGKKDQNRIQALRKAEYNYQRRKDQALLHKHNDNSYHNSQQSKQINENIYSKQESKLDTLSEDKMQEQYKMEEDKQLNSHLMKVMDDLQTNGLSFSKKKFNENIDRMIDLSDLNLQKNDTKKQTLYQQVKKLDNLESRVGPAYSKIIQQRRKAELSKLRRHQNKHQQQQQLKEQHHVLQSQSNVQQYYTNATARSDSQLQLQRQQQHLQSTEESYLKKNTQSSQQRLVMTHQQNRLKKIQRVTRHHKRPEIASQNSIIIMTAKVQSQQQPQYQQQQQQQPLIIQSLRKSQKTTNMNINQQGEKPVQQQTTIYTQEMVAEAEQQSSSRLSSQYANAAENTQKQKKPVKLFNSLSSHPSIDTVKDLAPNGKKTAQEQPDKANIADSLLVVSSNVYQTGQLLKKTNNNLAKHLLGKQTENRNRNLSAGGIKTTNAETAYSQYQVTQENHGNTEANLAQVEIENQKLLQILNEKVEQVIQHSAEKEKEQSIIEQPSQLPLIGLEEQKVNKDYVQTNTIQTLGDDAGSSEKKRVDVVTVQTWQKEAIRNSEGVSSPISRVIFSKQQGS